MIVFFLFTEAVIMLIGLGDLSFSGYVRIVYPMSFISLYLLVQQSAYLV